MAGGFKVELEDRSLLKLQALVGGSWIDAASGATFPVTNPANGREITRVAECGASETRRAIDAAAGAFPSWRRLPARTRSRCLREWFELILASREDLARIITAEQGKPLEESRGEIAYGAAYIEWFAEEAKRIYGDIIPSTIPGSRVVVVKEPVGVVACITPWNFPSALLARKVAPALAAGCTVVCKPANETPLSALALAELARRAGIPGGVINVVAGKTREIGAEMTGNPAVRKLTFTGSTEVGKLLVKQCAETVKRTSMELGGNAPFVVFDDADLDLAVASAVRSKFRNSGQTCVCANRILVQGRVHDAFVAMLVEAVSRMKLGDGRTEGVSIGPLITEEAAGDVLALIDDAVSRGARVAAGGGRSRLGRCFVEPTVLTGVTPEMRVFREEIFGPVAAVLRFDTEEEAVRLANDTPFGLACYFFSRDLGRAWRVGEDMEFGIVGINEGMVSNEMAPFGGIKESGHGREGSKYGIDEYVEIKYMLMAGLGASARDGTPGSSRDGEISLRPVTPTYIAGDRNQ